MREPKDELWTGYREAGHDLESLLDVNTVNRCTKCGAYLIDLSEDLVFGPVRKCKEASDA